MLHRICGTNRIRGHPIHHRIYLFVRPTLRPFSEPHRKAYLILPFSTTPVLVASDNEFVCQYLQKEFPGCALEEQPVTVAKHLAEVMNIDMMVLSSVSCDRCTGDMEWDAYHHKIIEPLVVRETSHEY